MTNDEKIYQYKKSLESAWGFNDYNDWPIKYNSIMHLFLNEFTQEFIEDLTKLKSKGVTTQVIAAAFYNPSRIYRIIHTVIYGMKHMRYSASEQKDMVVEMLSLIEPMKYGSVFNENGKNIILCPDQLVSALQVPFTTVQTKDPSVMLHRALGILWAYTEAIFFRAHDVTKEIHGLYNLGSSSLLIREYMNLMPETLWDIEPVGCNRIKILIKYKKEIDIKLDSYNHLFHQSGSLVDSLLEYCIQIDDRVSSLEELYTILPIMSQNIILINRWANQVDWREKAKKYAEIYWLRKSPLRNLLGERADITEKVLENIEAGQIEERRTKNLTDQQIKYLIYSFI